MLSDYYENREQSEAKHEILKRYLVPFANKILTKWDSIDFIDGFCGPWENRDTEHLTDTSIGIALSTLSDVAEKLPHKTGQRRIRCIFNEADPASYKLLQEYLVRAKADYPLLKIESLQGKFADNALEIRRRANHAFQLLFIDPTGYTGFPPASLALFKGRSSEIIVNFMRSFIGRFVAGDHRDRERNLIELLGEKRARFLLDTGVTVQSVENEYLSMLRGTLSYEFAGFSPIHNPDREEIQFNLAYATNHFAGMEVMRSAEYKALSEHDRKRFVKSAGDNPFGLFGNMMDEMEIMGPYLKKRKAHLRNASEEMEKLVAKHPEGLAFGTFAATIQQKLFLKRSELGTIVVEMADKGILKPTWLARGVKIRKPNEVDLILPA